MYSEHVLIKIQPKQNKELFTKSQQKCVYCLIVISLQDQSSTDLHVGCTIILYTGIYVIQINSSL